MRWKTKFRCFLSYYKFLQEHQSFESVILAPFMYVVYRIVALGLPSSILRFCAHKWAHGETAELKATAIGLEIYTVLSTAVLVVGVYSEDQRRWGSFWTAVVIVIAVVRICEILSQSVEVILKKIDVEAPSTMATLGIYVIQSVAIFTICAELVGAGGFGSHPQSWRDFLYMTWNNMATLGSSYSATSGWGRLVVAGSNVTAILLFSVLLGFAVGKLGEDRKHPAMGAAPATSGSTTKRAPDRRTENRTDPRHPR